LLLFLALLLASDDKLLRLYNIVLPCMALILFNFAAAQRFLDSTCFGEPSPAPSPPPPAGWWSRLVSYISGILEYFVTLDQAPAAQVEEATCDWSDEVFYAVSMTTQLVVSTSLVSVFTLNSSIDERIALTILVNLFTVPCVMKIVVAPKSDVDFANSVVCWVVCSAMELWSSFCLERMIYTSVRSMYEVDAHRHPSWMMLELWYRTRRLLFVSWLIAFSAQFADSLLQTPSNLSYAEMMWFNLRHGSSTPTMYLGLCSAIGYLTGSVWKTVYCAVALSAARQDVSDHGLSELLTLVHIRLIACLAGISTSEMFSFVIPFLISVLTVVWTLRALRPLLLSVDRLTCVRACVVYILTIVLLPYIVVKSTYGDKVHYMTGNLFIALSISVKAASVLVQSLVRRCKPTEDADEFNFVIKVSS